MDGPYPEPTLIIEAIKIVTTPAHGQPEAVPSTVCHLDRMLALCTATLDQALRTDAKFVSMKNHWLTYEHVVIPAECSVRWKYVLYCLKLLNILQLSLKASVQAYKASKPRNVRPSGAPPISPDTLSVTDQKVIMSSIQFIVCLGICPYLQQGAGINLEIRSEFSDLLKTSSTAEDLTDIEKNERLFTCVKVLVLCIHAPSLGTLILSRHLVDVLAALMQLVHSDDSGPSSGVISDRGESDRVGSGRRNMIIIHHTAIQAEEGVPSQDRTVAGSTTPENETNSCMSTGDGLPEGNIDTSRLTPASAVDTVRCKFSQTDNGMDSCSNSCSSTLAARPESDSCSDGDDGISHMDGASVSTGNCIDKEFCQRNLQDLLEKIYPPLLVKTLLMLQGGPKLKKSVAGGQKPLLTPAPAWLRRVCGSQLTTIIMKPKGVQSVLRGMLDNPTGAGVGMVQAADWRKCDAVAKVIACCPLQSVSVEAYYKTVAPQILELLHIRDKQVARQFLRVACSTIGSMAARRGDLTRDLVITPLLQPLLQCTRPPDGGVGGDPRVVVREEQVSGCVEDCHKVFVSAGTVAPDLVHSLRTVVLPMFELYVFTKTGVSSLKSACHEVLVCYLKQCEPSVAAACLELMVFQQTTRAGQDFPGMQPHLEFANGGAGGVVVITTPDDREVSESSRDARVQCMVDLLGDLQTSGTAAEFLIFLLQELTGIIGSEIYGETGDMSGISPRSGEQPLLELDDRQQQTACQWYRRLMVLDLLAAVCDRLGPSCITNTHHTLQFVKATLERAVQVCQATTDSVFAAFESETLTMALGLLTAVLSGGQQMTDADRKSMDELLPLLLNIENNHPDVSVQEMTSDLRIAIATHGMVWSELMKSTSSNFTKKVPNQSPAGSKPKIEEIAAPVGRAPVDVETVEPSVSATISQQTRSPGSDTSIPGSSQTDSHTSGAKSTKQSQQTVSSHSGETSLNVNIHDRKTHSEEQLQAETNTERQASDSQASLSELQQAFTELCDPLLPVRGHALISLTNLVRKKDPETCAKKDVLFKVFLENLAHKDSYLYLAAVNGLAALADIYPDMVINAVCEQFTAATGGGVTEGGAVACGRPAELRMKLGEILVKASRSLGDTIPRYKDVLLSTALRCARDSDPLVRASSLCNLGEICKLLHFSLGWVTQEVFTCCSGLLKSDPSAEVRKAAAAAVTLLLQGLGADAVKVLDNVLRDLYRLLKNVLTTETDDTVKLHAHLALNELDDIMRSCLFPEQKLEKKIRVLHAE